MPPPIPYHVRVCIIRSLEGGMHPTEAAEIYQVGLSSVYRILEKHRNGESLVPAVGRRGRNRIIGDDHRNYFN